MILLIILIILANVFRGFYRWRGRRGAPRVHDVVIYRDSNIITLNNITYYTLCGIFNGSINSLSLYNM